MTDRRDSIGSEGGDRDAAGPGADTPPFAEPASDQRLYLPCVYVAHDHDGHVLGAVQAG